jgi:hypothetical protein
MVGIYWREMMKHKVQISQRIYRALQDLYPSYNDHMLEQLTSSSRGMIGKMRTGNGVLGLNVATWLAKAHPEHEPLRAEAYKINAANRSWGSKKSQKTQKKRRPKQTSNIQWPAPKYAFPFHQWEC